MDSKLGLQARLAYLRLALTSREQMTEGRDDALQLLCAPVILLCSPALFFLACSFLSCSTPTFTHSEAQHTRIVLTQSFSLHTHSEAQHTRMILAQSFWQACHSGKRVVRQRRWQGLTDRKRGR
jgi:hypothetical protein